MPAAPAARPDTVLLSEKRRDPARIPSPGAPLNARAVRAQEQVARGVSQPVRVIDALSQTPGAVMREMASLAPTPEASADRSVSSRDRDLVLPRRASLWT